MLVQSCRLLPPTLSDQDVPGRAGGGGTSSTKPELLAPLVKTKLRLLFPSTDSPLAHLPGASFGFFQQHMLTRNWPPVPRTKTREASLAAIQRRHRSQSGLKDKRRHSMDSMTHFGVIKISELQLTLGITLQKVKNNISTALKQGFTNN